MAKFQKTGAITHYATHAPTYGDHTSVELLDAQIVIADSLSMFEELPSSIRKKFENDPGTFLDFVQDPKNEQEMIDLGLKASPPVVQPGAPTAIPEEQPSGSPENNETED